MPNQPQNKRELLQRIEREWELLLHTAEALTDEQMSKPDAGGWSPKDNLAHLAEWLNILLGYHMQKRPAHQVLRVSKAAAPEWQTESINIFLFERNQNKSRTVVMGQLKRTYAKVHAHLKATPFSALLKPRHADDPKKRPLLLWVLGDTTYHFREHRLTIKRGLKKRA